MTVARKMQDSGEKKQRDTIATNSAMRDAAAAHEFISRRMCAPNSLDALRVGAALDGMLPDRAHLAIVGLRVDNTP
ncbi:hypothetical protein [Bradyrhizobium sp. SZCCHNR2028]|uniref:hypothetical protein n=2 Tax=Bradyrhizobium TaxID=374 RepID=UPI0028EF801F|nr:hypothetical protein [Bradyrhizobium sp. SZCCHNR2028]